MDLKWLRNLVEVVETGNITRAASHLNIAQPALSRQMRQLEQYLGAKLLQKEGRGIVVTEAGQAAGIYSERIVGAVNRLLQEARARATVPTGAASLGTPPSVAQVLFVPLVRRYRAEYPEVRLRLLESTTALLDWLADGTVDLAILSSSVPSTDLKLSLEPLLTEQLYFVYPSDRRSFGPVCSIEDIVDLPFVFPATKPRTRTIIEDYARKRGKAPNIVVETEGLPFALELVRIGMGYTVLPYSAFATLVHTGGIGISRLKGCSITRVLAYRADRPLSKAASELANMLRTELAKLNEAGSFGASATFDALSSLSTQTQK